MKTARTARTPPAPPSLPPALVTRIERALKALYPDALKVVACLDKATGPGSRARPLEVIIRVVQPPLQSWAPERHVYVAGGTLNRWTFATLEEASAGVEKRFESWLACAIDRHARDAAAKREEAAERMRAAEREDVRARDVREVLMAFALSGVSVGEIGR